MKPWNKWPGVLLGMLLLAACQQGDGTADESDANDEFEEEETPAIPVETSSATRGDILAIYSGTAPVEAFSDATVIAKVGGEVREILVEEGDDVEAGQVLARLDGDRLRLEQLQTEANLRKLQQDYRRNIDLNEKGLISAGDFDRIRYEMDSLEAANKLAKLQLSYSDIRTPIAGVVSERFIKIGNMLEVESPAFQVTTLTPLVSYLHVPEREFRRIEASQDATLIIDALGGARFPAIVVRVSPIVDPATGTFKITIEVTDETRQLKPGMFARIAIVYDQHVNALQVPRSALIDEAGVTSVFVVEDDIAYRRNVKTGFANAGQIEITEGLSDSESFVTVGQSGLKNESKVIIIGVPGAAGESEEDTSDSAVAEVEDLE